MKNVFYIVSLVAISLFIGCNSTTKPIAENTSNKKFSDTVRIANDSIEYEVIIIDPGFNSWLASNARTRGFYSQNYLESRNYPWVVEWNIKASSPRNSYEANLYQMPIDYESGTNYGYEVNYMLYNYLVYFQIKNNIRLSGFMPRP
ncbi:DUF6146 family protein [Flavobacterium sp. SM15]|uniref:DUF6146 family protein n=1 Tax=Flavobacterium sp. SM15 TaxID=2908005 RepID=UPI001EDC5E17|nr:DUF6146 family protein [Flavobacterium sp. SM15]MCG2611886.1 DUF6146 family protein [Flavobacterium sp. SM15]